MSGLYAVQHLERKARDTVSLDNIRHMLLALGLAETALERYRTEHGDMAGVEQIVAVMRETREGVAEKVNNAQEGRHG